MRAATQKPWEAARTVLDMFRATGRVNERLNPYLTATRLNIWRISQTDRRG